MTHVRRMWMWYMGMVRVARMGDVLLVVGERGRLAAATAASATSSERLLHQALVQAVVARLRVTQMSMPVMTVN